MKAGRKEEGREGGKLESCKRASLGKLESCVVGCGPLTHTHTHSAHSVCKMHNDKMMSKRQNVYTMQNAKIQSDKSDRNGTHR